MTFLLIKLGEMLDPGEDYFSPKGCKINLPSQIFKEHSLLKTKNTGLKLIALITDQAQKTCFE